MQPTIEQVRAQFFDESALVEPPYTLYRADGGGDRVYYEPNSDRFYRSVTTVIQANQPASYGLLEWIKTNGQDADRLRDERAAYGTFLHIELADLIISGQYDFDELPERVHFAAKEAGANSERWYKDTVKSVLSFEAFRREHSVEPLAVEVCLKSDKGYAGTIDLVCRMKIGSGARGNFIKKDAETGGTPIVGLVDFKSNMAGNFYADHEIQLHMYRDMWHENFPDMQVDRLFNWSPSDWRTEPTYKLSDQTDSKHAARIPHLLELDKLSAPAEPPAYLLAEGIMTADTDLSSVYKMATLRDQFEGMK